MLSSHSLKGCKLLITGASGYLGSWMAEYALQAGANVRILLRQIPSYLQTWTKKFEVVMGDIRDKTVLQKSCYNQEIVWHAASVNEIICNRSFEEALLTNVVGTANLMEAAANEKVITFIKFSTFHVYGVSDGQNINEKTPTNPSSTYGLTSLLGEQIGNFYQKTRGLHVISPRISNGYGVPLFKEINRWSIIVNHLCKMAFSQKQITLNSSGNQHRDFISIHDIFKAMVLLSSKPTDDLVINVGGGNSRSILEIAQLVKKVYDQRYGTNIPLNVQPKKAGESQQKVCYDIFKLTTLGFYPEDRLEAEIEKIFDLLEDSIFLQS